MGSTLMHAHGASLCHRVEQNFYQAKMEYCSTSMFFCCTVGLQYSVVKFAVTRPMLVR